jgi:hypothetical protein
MPSGFGGFLDEYIMTELLHNGQPVWLGAKNGAFATACCGERAGIWAFKIRSHYASFKPSTGSECSDECRGQISYYGSSGKWVLYDGNTWRPANVSMDGPLTLESTPLRNDSLAQSRALLHCLAPLFLPLRSLEVTILALRFLQCLCASSYRQLQTSLSGRHPQSTCPYMARSPMASRHISMCL